MDLEGVKQMVEEMIPFAKKAGVKLEAAGDRQVKLVCPHEPTNLNPFGSFHPGSLTTLGETAMGALLLVLFDPEKLSFVNKDIYIRFRRPGMTNASVSMTMTEQQVNEITAETLEKGKLDKQFECQMTDEAGTVIAEMKGTFQFRKAG
jgi:uncharacterized protein (TIGR00369 family)